MRKIKILHILHSVGGVDVSLRLILSHLNKREFENVVVHGKTDTQEVFLDQENQPVTSYETDIVREISAFKDLKTLRSIYRIAIIEKPDLIHAHSAKGGVLGKILGQRLSIPVLHTPQAYSFLSAESKTKKNLFLRLERFFSNFNNKILASSPSERNRAINEVGYKPEKTMLFNNSIEPIEKVSALGIEKTWPDEYICSVGRPSYQKNIEMMIGVLKEIKKIKPNIHLVLMGMGFHSPNLENVERLIKIFQLEKNVSLLQWTDRKDIFNIIKNSQLYISTARYEGLPYSIIEALALKKACVVTDADGNRDLVEDGKNGFVIQEENEKLFADRVLELFQNEKLRKEFEENSLKRFNSHYNIHNTIHLLEEIYQNNSKGRKEA